MALQQTKQSSLVRVTVPELVSLSETAATLSLGATRGRTRQSGDYLSRFKGRGMEFEESRPYEPGDDVRNLHWRVMARTGKPFTKLFREERERPVFLCLDLRERMFFATRGVFKSVLAARAATLIAWTACQQGDRVGGVLFSDEVHDELMPARGKAAVLRFINRVAGHAAWDRSKPAGRNPGAFGQAIIRLRRVVRPGSLVFVFSDFHGLDDIAEANLVQIARHNEIMLVFTHDEFEQRLPPPGHYRLSDGEDEFVLDAGDKDYRTLYERRFAEHLQYWRGFARRHRMLLLPCRTDDDPAATLRAGLRFGART
jgi:uncharacterized protein (DUF58 family)